MTHLTLFSPYRALPLYPRTEPDCKLPCQTSAKNIRLNSIATCAMSRHSAKMMLPCMSLCCADIERNRSKKGGFFLQETMPCIHGPSLCVCMPALVVAVLIAYDYECARKLSASLFSGSQKQAFLASWLWALIVYIFKLKCSKKIHVILKKLKKQPASNNPLKQLGTLAKEKLPQEISK